MIGRILCYLGLHKWTKWEGILIESVSCLEPFSNVACGVRRHCSRCTTKQEDVIKRWRLQNSGPVLQQVRFYGEGK